MLAHRQFVPQTTPLLAWPLARADSDKSVWRRSASTFLQYIITPAISKMLYYQYCRTF